MSLTQPLSASVVICTHNPRASLLARTVESLRAQTEPAERWEFILVDNNSTPPVSERIDLAWHPAARIVREERTGLTHARLRGIAEATAPLIIFVDDDNVLARDYVETAIRIGAEHPFLGAWGGTIRGEFETPPPHWARQHLGLLAIRDCHRATWTNEPYGSQSTPVGAGMCIRKQVADAYAAATAGDPLRIALGRAGSSMMACEDTEMAHASFEFDLGVGVFPQLSLTHLIPAERLQPGYLERVAEGRQASIVLMRALRGDPTPHPLSDHPAKRIYSWVRLACLPVMERRLLLAEVRGYRKGEAMVRTMNASRQSGK
ncbi:MAG: glycosyltransferase [Planctomycetia bacterium]